MKFVNSVGAAILVAAGLTACERETKTVVNTTPAAPASSTTTSTTTSTASTDTGVLSTTVDYTKSMEGLQQTAQRLREAIQAMAQQPAGPQRNQAIKEARQALNDTNQAMIQLPPGMRVESVGTTSSAGAVGSVGAAPTMGSRPDDPGSMDALQKAAQKLRESIQAMAQEPAGTRRDQAIKEAHQALYNTNQAMIQLPPEK